MATDITVWALDHTVVIYFDDGNTATVAPGANYPFSLQDNGFCTISETLDSGYSGGGEIDGGVSEEEGEHPPPGLAFAEMMVEFWSSLASDLKGG